MKKNIKKSKTRFVLVRTFSAGVHFGELVSLRGRHAVIKNSRNIWRYRGANTLNELSLRGCDEDWSRISEPVERVELTEVIQILDCTPEAVENLSKSRWGK